MPLSWISEELAAIERRSLKRSLRIVDGTQGARITVEGKPSLNFSSNNYLGLACHAQVIKAAAEALQRWGAGAASSRLIGGSLRVHQDLEASLAVFMRKQACLLFPSGYMANLGVVASLAGAGDAVILTVCATLRSSMRRACPAPASWFIAITTRKTPSARSSAPCLTAGSCSSRRAFFR